MNSNNRYQSVWLAVAIMVAGIAIEFFPARYQQHLETVVRDLLKPGQEAVLSTWSMVKHSTEAVDKRNETHQVDHWQLKARLADYQRQLQFLNGELNSLRQVQKTPPLFLPVTIEARVLSASQLNHLSRGFVIGEGTNSELFESELVVTDDGPIIDVGTDADLETDSLLLASGTVIGSINHVGRWSSSVRRVTDDGFRTSVQLLRCSGEECVFGAVGSLHGQGKSTCSLQYVSATESVAVGDLVVTNSTSNASGVISKIGVVKTAALEPGAEFWDVEVEPAFHSELTIPTKVLILKQTQSSTRVLTN